MAVLAPGRGRPRRWCFEWERAAGRMVQARSNSESMAVATPMLVQPSNRSSTLRPKWVAQAMGTER